MSYDIPQRLFLDTNIYIIGVANENSYERKILASVGFLQPSSVEIIVSEEFECLTPQEFVNKYLS